MNKDQYLTILETLMDLTIMVRKEMDNQNKRIDELMEYVARIHEDDKPKEPFKSFKEETENDMKEILFQVGYKKSYEKIIGEVTRKGLESDLPEMLYVVRDKPNFCAYKFYFRKIYETYYPLKIQKVDL